MNLTKQEAKTLLYALSVIVEKENDTINYSNLFEKLKKARDEKEPDYEKGFEILMEYWDSIHDEEKPKADKRLKRCGL